MFEIISTFFSPEKSKWALNLPESWSNFSSSKYYNLFFKPLIVHILCDKTLYLNFNYLFSIEDKAKSGYE